MTGSNPEDPGRRDFLKKLVVLVGATALSSFGLDSLAREGGFLKENEVEAFIKGKIEEAKDIIKNNRYEQVLENPFLVSALYHSPGFIEKIKIAQTTNPQRIIAGISPYITSEFRQNYIRTLENVSIERDLEKVISQRESVPVRQVNIPKNLLQNHQDAIDLFIDEGSPIFPMAGGLVVLAESGWRKDNDLSTSSVKGGNTVIIFNPNNRSFYRYEHMEDVFVRTGEIVGSGANIGTVGHTGLNASKPGHGGHLHLEVNVYSEEDDSMKTTNVFVLKERLERANTLAVETPQTISPDP